MKNKKPTKVGMCNYCNNPVYDWSGNKKKKSSHEICKEEDLK